MEKKKLIINLLAILILAAFSAGCADQKEIENRAYVIALGMDKGEENHKIKISYLIANPEYGSQQTGTGTEEPPHEIVTFETNDMMISTTIANSDIAKEISYDLLRTFIVSEELAKDKNFIRWMYDATKGREIRRDTHFLVTKEDVSKFFLKNQPLLETRPHKYFDLIVDTGIQNGAIPDADLNKFFRITEADADLFLGIYGTTEREESKSGSEDDDHMLAGELDIKGRTNTTQFIGSAIFKEGVMIGKLTAEETRLSILLNQIYEPFDINFTFPDPFNENYHMSATLRRIKHTDIDMNLNQTDSTINVSIHLLAEILTDHSMINYASDNKQREVLKSYLENRIEQKMEKFVTKTQEEFKAQPFGWSLVARKQFSTIPEYEQFNWMKSYPDMDVNINVDIKFGEFGRQTRLPSLKQVRD